jgi:hypothetical protein
MEVLEWQAISVQHLVCPVAQRIDVECTGIHTAFIAPHTLPPLCDPSSSCPSPCPASSNPFPKNTTIIHGDVYSHATSQATSQYHSMFAAVFNCPEGVHTLAGAFCEGTVPDVVFYSSHQRTFDPKFKAAFDAQYENLEMRMRCQSQE